MNTYSFASILCFILSIICLLLGLIVGEIQGGIFLFFPFLIGTGIFAFLGFLCIFLSIIFFLFSFTKRESIDGSYVQTVESSDQKKSIKRGGILLIGPIPIVFASSWRIALVFMIVAIIFMIIFWVLF